MEKKEDQIRPIHYLGSKLRVLEFIKSVIDEIDPTKSEVVDLFTGSGTVAKYLSNDRKIVAVDIQEYSKVICDALLNPIKIEIEVNDFINKAFNSEHSKKLFCATKKIRDYENNSLKNMSDNENKKNICEIIEYGTLLSFEKNLVKESSEKLRQILSETYNNLKEIDYIKGPEALLTRYYGGAYFSYNQTIELDIILFEIFKLDSKYRNIFLAAALSTASDIVNTVGKQFAQPLKAFDSEGKPKKNIENKILKDRTLDVKEYFAKWLNKYIDQEEPKYKNVVYKMDSCEALDLIGDNVKVVYADPPYTRYHYSRYYHVLETIALRDNPEISKTTLRGITNISRGIYRVDRFQSSFSIKTKSELSFRELFKKISDKKISLILSYSPYEKNEKSTPRIYSIENLVELAKEYFDSVEVRSVGEFSHSKLNKSNNNFDITYDAELLIICKTL